MRLLLMLIVALLMSGAAVPAVAGPYEDGYAAYVKRDYATALRLARPLADQGNGRAQALLGGMYLNGYGVPEDYVLAHMWFYLAAAQDQAHETLAAMNRGIVAARMTPAQIAEAQKLAREWKPK